MQHDGPRRGPCSGPVPLAGDGSVIDKPLRGQILSSLLAGDGPERDPRDYTPECPPSLSTRGAAMFPGECEPAHGAAYSAIPVSSLRGSPAAARCPSSCPRLRSIEELTKAGPEAAALGRP
jgi:hypothetical protein